MCAAFTKTGSLGYGWIGVCLDQNQMFCGLKRGNNDLVLYQGFDPNTSVSNTVCVTEGAYICGMVLQGPSDTFSPGTITITDTTRKTFTFLCNVHTGKLVTDPSLYTSSYSSPVGEVIDVCAIHVNWKGDTVLHNMTSQKLPLTLSGDATTNASTTSNPTTTTTTTTTNNYSLENLKEKYNNPFVFVFLCLLLVMSVYLGVYVYKRVQAHRNNKKNLNTTSSTTSRSSRKNHSYSLRS